MNDNKIKTQSTTIRMGQKEVTLLEIEEAIESFCSKNGVIGKPNSSTIRVRHDHQENSVMISFPVSFQ